jgi:microcystin-dependent protein
MADTVTPKLGFTKPEVGASNNTWGTKTNGNWDIVDGKMVYNTIQWHITMGDEVAASTTGPFVITRYGNDGLRIDDPIIINRQTGAANILAISQPYRAPPATPPAGVATVYIDANGNPCIMRPDGNFQYLGVPPGTVGYTPGATADFGWALCNGQGVLRAANPGLSLRIPVGMWGSDATTIILPDIRGRVVAHVDGGTNRLITTFNGNALGNAGGLDYHYLTAAQMAQHPHGYSGSATTGGQNQNHNHNYTYPYDYNPGVRWFDSHTATTYGTTTTGIENQTITHNFSWSGNTDVGGSLGNSWHPNAQPTIVLNAQIKLG